MRNLSPRDKMMDNYLYLKTVLPLSFKKIYVTKRKKEHRFNYFSQYITNDDSDFKSKQYNQTIILTTGSIPKKKKLKIKLLSPNRPSPRKDIPKEMYKISEEKTINLFEQGTKYFDPNEIKQLNLYGTSNILKSSPVKSFEYKKNLYLPTITQRMKNSRPRYERNFNNTLLN